jgi:formate dehydrogenase iron-sulfur subunit
LPADRVGLTGNSYDNTGELSATSWRHVKFVERVEAATSMPPFQSNWLMMSDVCKHCAQAGCPFGVVELDMDDGKAHKCTLCYDSGRA